MPAIDFPNSPTTNQIFNSGGKSWRYDGTVWLLINSHLEVNVDLSTTDLDGGAPDTKQFNILSEIDAGGVS
jgi:hypothetical protein